MGLKLINISKSYGLGIGKPRKKILDNVNAEKAEAKTKGKAKDKGKK